MHPVRTGANYCGYCGTSLVPTPSDPAPTSRVSSKARAEMGTKLNGKPYRAPKKRKPGRYWVRVPITLLVVVILSSLAIRYWPQILVFFGQVVVLLKLT